MKTSFQMAISQTHSEKNKDSSQMTQEKSTSRKLNLLASRFPKFSLTYIFVFAYLGVGAFEGIYGYAFASEFKNNIANLTLMIVSYHFGVSNSQKKEDEKKEG